jgi:hypothetical protein
MPSIEPTESAMSKLEFFIECRDGGYVLADADGDLHVRVQFPDEESAAETAVRFAQDHDELYAIHYPLSAGH